MGDGSGGMIVIALALTLLVQSVYCSEPISILDLGSIGRGKPYLLMRSDPLFSISLVQASLRAGDFPLNIIHDAQKVEVVPRLLRLYMPRSYQDLVSRFDVIVFNNANALVLADYTNVLARGAIEGGLGLFMSGGWESFGGVSGFPPWGDTPIGELLPTGDVPGEYFMTGRLVVDEPQNELMSSLPWESPRAL